MIKAIFLDMGGVIVDLDINICIETFKKNVGCDRIAEFLDPCIQRGFIKLMEEGAIDARQFCEECRKYCNPGTTDEEIEYCLSELLRSIDPGKAGYIRELSARYPLYMLSNNNPITWKRSRELFEGAGIPVEKIFRGCYVSYEMKLLKPGREIFEEAVRRTGIPANEILFLDDSQTNVNGAAAAGLNAVLFNQGEDLKTAIETALRKFN